MGDDDLALLDRWCAGDAIAGNHLFRRHYDAVYRFFRHKIDGDAADLVQETFLACVAGRDQFRRTSSFRTYLFAIARNLLYGHWRKRSSQPDAVDFDQVSIARLSTTAGARIDRDRGQGQLLAALRELPLEQQLLLELHYWEDLDGDDLAAVFDIAAPTTRSRLFRARQALRDALGRFSAGPHAPATDDDLDAWARSQGPSDRLRNASPGADTTGES